MGKEMFCPSCRLQQPAAHDYCVRCGTSLPHHLLEVSPQESKKSRFFPGVKVHEGDPDPGFLRVSCYLREQTFEAPEGAVRFTGRHVRFSIWDHEQAACVLSVPETEARGLASFITTEMDRLGKEHPAEA